MLASWDIFRLFLLVRGCLSRFFIHLQILSRFALWHLLPHLWRLWFYLVMLKVISRSSLNLVFALNVLVHSPHPYVFRHSLFMLIFDLPYQVVQVSWFILLSNFSDQDIAHVLLMLRSYPRLWLARARVRWVLSRFIPSPWRVGLSHDLVFGTFLSKHFGVQIMV